jgi:protoporphyrinogen oxidase
MDAISKSGGVVCIGGGPAGLTAAYLLGKSGIPVTVLERDPVYVGGISRTVTRDGFHFDIGGHRFFSKAQDVEALWDEILGADFLRRSRKSRIYYNRKLFAYPLRANEALLKLGVIESCLCVASYAYARLKPRRQPQNLAEWVTNQFGARLFGIFFKTYTEKVWGTSCSEISASWAAQRIKGLSLSTAIWNAVHPASNSGPRTRVIKTLIDSFRYPRRGPGMMWEAAAAKTRAAGGRILMGLDAVECILDPVTGKWKVAAVDASGRRHEFSADHVISSMPMRDLVRGLKPEPADAVRVAAEALRYRDFIVVALIVRDRGVFDDNWIYIHDPDVKVGRIQNFKSWSPEMVPDSALNCLGLEYFCFEGDGLWSMRDNDLVALGIREIVELGLLDARDVLGGHVVRQAKAYPVHDNDYQTHVDTIRTCIRKHYPGLHPVGRNGMHKYNNQDHSMMTAMLTVKNILAGQMIYDVWNVNEDAEYLETAAAEPGTPTPRPAESLNSPR